MSSELSEKLKLIREAEGLSQAKFADLTGISISTIKKYEVGIMEPGGVTLRKITTHESFKKYTLWLMSDETNEASGQIAPALSLMGKTAHRAAEARRRLANSFKHNGKMGQGWDLS